MSMAYAVYLRVYGVILGGGHLSGEDVAGLKSCDEITAMAIGACSARISLANCGQTYGPIGPMTAHELQIAIARLHGFDETTGIGAIKP